MPTFETKIYALGVYWHAEVTYQCIPYDFRETEYEITDLWLLGCYPEGCESGAVDRNDYESVRIKAELGYLEPEESKELIRRCQDHNAVQYEIAMERDYEI